MVWVAVVVVVWAEASVSGDLSAIQLKRFFNTLFQKGWRTILVQAIIFMFSLGIASSFLLAIASRIFYVEEDPRLEAIKTALPGLNCGA